MTSSTIYSRVSALRPLFASVAACFPSLPWQVLAAIAERESRCGEALGPDLLGDSGHGRGIMQIDDRTWGTWLEENDWRNPSINIAKGADIFASGLYLGPLGAVAAYNAGPSSVKRYAAMNLKKPAEVQDPEFFDPITAGRNYVSSVYRLSVEIERLFAEAPCAELN